MPKNPRFFTKALTALALSLSVALPHAHAGVEELNQLLRSPVGRQILRELRVTGGIVLAEVTSGSDIARAEATLGRLRDGYLQRRPDDRTLFEASSAHAAFSDEQLTILRNLLVREDFQSLRTLNFVPETRVANGAYAGARDAFLGGSGARVGAPASGVATERGIRFRGFVRDLVQASSLELPAARAQGVRQVLAQNLEFAEFLIEGNDIARLLAESDLAFVSTPGGAAGTGMLDFEHLFATRIQGQIQTALTGLGLESLHGFGQQYGETMTAFISRIFGSDAAQSALRPTALSLVRNARTLSPEARLAVLATLGDEPYLEIARTMDSAIQTANISESPALRQVLDPNAGIDLSGMPQSKAELFGRLLTRYFDGLPIVAKRKILGAVLELAPHSPVEKQIAAVLHNSGPAAQKLFQLVGRDARSPLIRGVMRELLTNCRTFDGHLAARIVEQELGRPIHELFSEFDYDQPIAASVGQVHRARLRATGERVMVKVIKPGVREAAIGEIETFERIVGDSDFERDLVRNVREALMSELDLRIENRNLTAGARYPQLARNIEVAGAVAGLPATERVLVQKMARGVAMARLTTPAEMVNPTRLARMTPSERLATMAELKRRGDALNNLLSVWFERAIFEDGFFHADPHPGNLFYEEAVGSRAEPLLTLIDFGSADRLTLPQRRGFINFTLSVAAKSPEHTMAALLDFGDIPAATRPAMRQELVAIFNNGKGIVERVREVLFLAVNYEMRMPRELFQFTRGNMFIEKQLLEINSALDVLDPAAREGRYLPLATYARLSVRRGAMEMPTTLARMLPASMRDRLFALFGREASARVSTEVITGQTLETAWAASRARMLSRFQQ